MSSVSSANETFAWEKEGLTGLALAPCLEKPKKIIILLHGYMGDADSNMEFAHTLFQAVPESVVFVPNGIDPIPPGDDIHRRQWWNLDSAVFEGRLCSFMPYYAPKEKQPLIRKLGIEAHKTAKILNKFILSVVRQYGLNLADCFLVGISQGGMTAFEMTLFCEELLKGKDGDSLAGLIIIGAGIPAADRIKELDEKPLPPVPVLLMRGSEDDIFPKTVDYFSRSLLQEHGFPVTLKEVKSVHYGLEHFAASDVCHFIRERI